jgi:hypothetical protein
MLQWIKIGDLVVDDSYQRDLKRANWTAIRRIAEQFQWSRFSPVFVAPVEGGKFAIIDGQHRTHAAAICGFEDVPCQVVQMSQNEQAASFAAVNGTVTKVTLFQIFKAALAAGEGWALAAQKACAVADCQLMTYHPAMDNKKAGELFCVALVRQLVENGHSAAVTCALSSIRRSEFGASPEAYSNEILKPWFMAVVDRPWLVAAGTDLSNFVDKFDLYAALDRAVEFVKVKRRQGHTGISRHDIAAVEIGEGLDKTFPQRMSGPPATPARQAAE